MISSFILNLKPVNEENNKIKMYNNYRDLFALFIKEGIDREKLNKITISNFLTKDKFISEEKNYSLKISSIDSKVNVKILQILFKIRLTSGKIKIDDKFFWINNIYHDNNLSKQFDIEDFFEKSPRYKIKLRLVTPTFFKFGTKYICSLEPIYIFKNLMAKFKKSSLKDEIILSKKLDFSKIKIVENNLRKLKIKSLDNYGIIGEVAYMVDKDNEDLILAFNFLMEFAFFSGIGYLCEKGYGQNYIVNEN